MDKNKYINSKYESLKAIAYKFARGRPWHQDLLQEALLSAIQSPNIDGLIERNELEFYVIRSMYVSATSPKSKFYRKYVQVRYTHVDFIERLHEYDPVSFDILELNENMDILVSRLSEFERMVFEEYIFTDFSYKQLSEKTNIPVIYLYRTVESATKKLRDGIIRQDK